MSYYCRECQKFFEHTEVAETIYRFSDGSYEYEDLDEYDCPKCNAPLIRVDEDFLIEQVEELTEEIKELEAKLKEYTKEV